jgi:two-component system chemotaxis sensor kinase CheA
MAGEFDNIIQEFLVESYENLDQLDRDLVALEQNPQDRARLASIFRTIHTIKGTCGFFGFSKLESVAHVGENLLSKLRDGVLLLNPEITSALLAMVDAVREMLSNIERTSQEGDGDYSRLVETLSRLNGDTPTAAASASSEAPAAAPEATAPAPPEPAPEPAATTPKAKTKGRKRKTAPPGVTAEPASTPSPQPAASPAPAPTAGSLLEGSRPAGASIPKSGDEPPRPVDLGAPASASSEPIRLGELLIQRKLARPEDIERALQQQAGGDPRPLGEILVEHGTVQPQDLAQVLAAQPDHGKSTGLMEANIRVDVGLLDKLMNLVGELVLARNQILQFTSTQKDAAFLSTTQRLNLITTELQEGVMKTRMQPIGNIWNKFPRVVRDLAAQCGKQVRIEMEGKETDLDKTIIEAIKDPLTHVIRNAVDHGIERPDERTARGKPAEGCLSLRAFHEGGQVNIEISDDGGGINPEKVKQKALERGLITRDQASRLSEREMIQLIFLPGFSTAEKITNVSGRGVGMDVVKTNIEKIGGTVDLQSKPGEGTTLKIKIPLTLAIIPALIVTSGGDRYAIPQVSLLELVRLDGEQARKGIEMIHGSPVYRLRGNLLPLVYLHRELQVEDPAVGSDQDAINIVILQADDRQFGLVVQGINDTEEIVVKPLGKQLKGIPLFAGATIMGDGRVALILDVMGIAQRAGVISTVRDRTLLEKVARSTDQSETSQTLLLVGMGGNRRLAIPLSLVARLEEIPTDSVEWADGREVVQYRGQIMPLLRLDQVFGGGMSEGGAQDLMHVVVYCDGGKSIGLVVGRILDIVEASVQVRQGGRRPGIRGSVVIQQHVTDLVDIHEVIRTVEPSLFEEPMAVA